MATDSPVRAFLETTNDLFNVDTEKELARLKENLEDCIEKMGELSNGGRLSTDEINQSVEFAKRLRRLDFANRSNYNAFISLVREKQITWELEDIIARVPRLEGDNLNQLKKSRAELAKQVKIIADFNTGINTAVEIGIAILEILSIGIKLAK